MKYEMDLAVAALQTSYSPAIGKEIEAMVAEEEYSAICQYVNNTRALLRELLIDGNIQRLATLVPLCQRDTTRALDMLQLYLQSLNKGSAAGLQPPVHAYYVRLQYVLKRLLEYIFIDFGDYYNIYQKIPDYVIQRKQKKVLIFKQALNSKLEKTSINYLIEEQLLLPVAEFLKPGSRVSHYHLVYLRKYRSLFQKKCFGKLGTDQDGVLLLIRLRLNTHEAVEICLRSVLQAAVLLPEEERYNFLSGTISSIERLHSGDIDSFHPHLPDIGSVVVQHLAKELGCYLSPGRELQADKVQPRVPEMHEKIELSFSVDELALLFMLMSECGMIVNENYLTVMRTAVRSFATKRQKEISIKSFQNKSYTPEPSVAGKLQVKLMDLFNKAREH
ncbi:hypothetical protein [Ferruginibacter sp. HRS2-29]|uniref:hypothetical protein n=1 Tax=Ferruginibacter sp. HRS2-29 TaxID=2487334 RepID=UPI0020CDAAD7|nr:hypothetical protein [Ferruginibacter sp. HRS2-29]MCP9749488.1 hypothetical protein [Ferruginibacter sp. HRS2-29]